MGMAGLQQEHQIFGNPHDPQPRQALRPESTIGAHHDRGHLGARLLPGLLEREACVHEGDVEDNQLDEGRREIGGG